MEKILKQLLEQLRKCEKRKYGNLRPLLDFKISNPYYMPNISFLFSEIKNEFFSMDFSQVSIFVNRHEINKVEAYKNFDCIRIFSIYGDERIFYDIRLRDIFMKEEIEIRAIFLFDNILKKTNFLERLQKILKRKKEIIDEIETKIKLFKDEWKF